MEDYRVNFLEKWQSNEQYFDMLVLLSSLSNLFSDNSVPYLDYRVAENLFCKYFNAINDARSCTAYDARLGTLGIGIKTFGIKKTSTEKIAEFDRLKPQLDALSGKSLAVQLAQFRNERIDFANNTFDVSDSIYHIVGRCDGGLKIFNTSYDKIDIDDIHEVKDKEKSLSFVSGGEFYNFNKSKSVLMKRFFLPKEYKYVPVEILEDPLQLLSELLRKQTKELKKACLQKGVDYVVLPLYSTRGKVAHVQEKAGLNQWNASGRKRDENEVYIPIPAKIHKEYPDFFPTKDEPFELQLPHGESLSAKICQEGGKALMSNPNSALGVWILRKVLKKKPGELVTMEDLNRFGVDSVYIEKKHRKNDSGCEVFSISFTTSTYESYQNFFEED
jgi:hypothetical protein